MSLDVTESLKTATVILVNNDSKITENKTHSHVHDV